MQLKCQHPPDGTGTTPSPQAEASPQTFSRRRATWRACQQAVRWTLVAGSLRACASRADGMPSQGASQLAASDVCSHWSAITHQRHPPAGTPRPPPAAASCRGPAGARPGSGAPPPSRIARQNGKRRGPPGSPKSGCRASAGRQAAGSRERQEARRRAAFRQQWGCANQGRLPALRCPTSTLPAAAGFQGKQCRPTWSMTPSGGASCGEPRDTHWSMPVRSKSSM